MDKERLDKDLGSVQGFEDTSRAERTESVEGECHSFPSLSLPRFFSDLIGNQHFPFEGSSDKIIDSIVLGKIDFIRKRPMILKKLVPLVSTFKVDLVLISLNEIKL